MTFETHKFTAIASNPICSLADNFGLELDCWLSPTTLYSTLRSMNDRNDYCWEED